MLTPDQEVDLRWYFTEARGDCGLRSGMGGQIVALESSQLSDEAKRQHRAENPMYVRKHSGGRANHAEAFMARICDSGKPGRASGIAARLRRLPPCHQETLEAQFTSVEIVGAGVSALLATRQPLARETFRELRLRKLKRKPKVDRTGTPLMWLNNLISVAHHKPTSDEARILGTILAQARTALVHACEAYNA